MTAVIDGTALPVTVEAFHALPAGFEYGSETYGSHMYGAGFGTGPEQWQPITCAAVSVDMLRGTTDASRIVPVEQLLIELSDPELEVFQFSHTGSPILTRLEIADLIRVTVAGQPIITARIESITEQQRPAAGRLVTIEAFGLASDYAFQTQRGTRPSETAIERANALIAPTPYLGQVYTDTPAKTVWPAEDAEISLLQELDALAASQAAVFRTDRNGEARFDPYPAPYSGNGWTVTDSCDATGLVPVRIDWVGDQQQQLNIARVDVDTGTDVMPVTVSDALSINYYGPRDAARGFPAAVFTQSPTDATRFVGYVLDRAKLAVNRPGTIEFDTQTGTDWANMLPALDVDQSVDVHRTQATSVPTVWRCIISGYRLVITPTQPGAVRVAGELFLETIETSTT